MTKYRSILEERPDRFTIVSRGFLHDGLLSPCWEFQGHLGIKGHGQLRWEGKTQYVHRVSWTLSVGPIPADRWVLHRCNNARCGNPVHLYLGNHDDNMRDMKVSGRRLEKTRGEKSGRAIFTETDIPKIRKLALSVHVPDIAEFYGVSKSCIHAIVARRTWSFVK